MAYNLVRAKAITFLNEHGIDNPMDYKMSEIAYGCGAIVMVKPLRHSAGRIVFGKKDAIITINSRIESPKRGRFVLAHELGHFALHRHCLELHQDNDKNLDYFQNGEQEKEANLFANELLMPVLQFKSFVAGNFFEPMLLNAIAEQFKVSIISAAFRFAELGNHPILIAYSENGVLKYYKKSDDFEFRLQITQGNSIPKKSVAFEFFVNKISYALKSGRQEIYKSSWFFLERDERDFIIYEYCIPNEWNNSAISIIWAD